ncbi:MAG: hypothetical protein ABL959_09960 [Pyrinomonadaceae bacterium]
MTIPAQSSSAPSSTPSATPVPEPGPTATPTAVPAGFVTACAEAIEELRASRKLLASQGILFERQDELLKLERDITASVKNLRTLDAQQIAELNKALAAKDRVIAAVEAEVVVLKKQRMTFLRKVKYIAIGIVAGAAVCAVACRK